MVDDYLIVEIVEHLVIGPFQQTAYISRFCHFKTTKWRLIVDTSHSVDFNVNDRIPKGICSLSYITVDIAIKYIMELGTGALLAKMDGH